MKTVLITGGTGLLGTHLARCLLASGYRVIILTRKMPTRLLEPVEYAIWDPENGRIDPQAIAASDAVINLSGANINGSRWTPEYKKQIRDSRVLGTRLLRETLESTGNRCKTLVSASATGYYGAGGYFRETDPPAGDFLGQTCREWEESILPWAGPGRRLVILRLGIVLSLEGGALRAMLPASRLGIAAIPGMGTQWMSWIHLRDTVAAFQAALEKPGMSGVYNVASPDPARFEDLSIALARHLTGKCWLRVRIPPWLIGAALGEMGGELLKSCRVSPEKLSETGFHWQYPGLEEALGQLTQEFRGRSENP